MTDTPTARRLATRRRERRGPGPTCSPTSDRLGEPIGTGRAQAAQGPASCSRCSCRCSRSRSSVGVLVRQHLARVPRRRQDAALVDRHRHHAGDPGRRVAHRRRAATAHVVARDDHWADRRSSWCRRRAALARPEPRTRGGRGRRLRAAHRRPRSAAVDVEALASIKFNATEYDAPAGIVEFNYTGATGHTLPSRSRSSTASSSAPTPGAPKTGKVELDGRRDTRSTAPSPATRRRG